ncbi:TonB-dependent receptor [Halioxenophilus sp. WMMB6]|uniref:TonB-dependent receptor n=1 Tax=Halioxenophilus sp. WMMB6 TaxID=3073815 RepID=UPI00295F1CB0|nr:TonB-dependent receptor [Halioxenophilus sp. WMMB6]
MEEIVVTARKREENSQDVPLAITAYGSDQLDALKVRDLQSLSVGMPNVSLDDTGTVKGYANFSIRGLGINSSIISIDPTVGLFVDGVYMGLSAGQVFDVFDLESIEVLRGPQGTLFGKNVTGGAILINTKKPGDEFEAKVRAAVDGGGDGGLNSYLMGTVSGPLTDTLAGKFTAYYNNDDGWFENKYNGEDFGAAEQQMYRGVAVWTPTANTEFTLRYEHSEVESDGPAGQAHTNGAGTPGAWVNYDRDSFDFSVDETGYYNTDADFVSFETNIDVGFGDGTITNIFGWRSYDAESLGDIDSQPLDIFKGYSKTEAEQFSNELRYTGTFADRATVTTGLFYYTNNVDYSEGRDLATELSAALFGVRAPFLQFTGGGLYDVETVGAFASVDYDLTESLVLTAGIRYTNEKKEVEIASLSHNISGLGAGFVGLPQYVRSDICDIAFASTPEQECEPDFVHDDSWSSLSPKLGLTYLLSDDAQLYTHWTRGFRSGGYNLRNTSLNPDDTPGPFDDEQVDSYELGYKSTYSRGRLNAALFYTDVTDMQRELNFPGALGTVQLVRNTADATIMGLELDGAYSVTTGLLLTASLGLTDSEYTKVKADLNGDGETNNIDKKLDLPRAPELTYSVGVVWDLNVGSVGYITSRLSYAYRDESAYTDSNYGYITEQEIVDAGIDFYTNDGHWNVGLYGKNLLDEVKHGGDTQLPDTIAGFPAGGTFSPLTKGRVYGIEMQYNF